MRRFAVVFGGALIALIPAQRTVARSPTPVLVELFTSEGCSSCPPADTFLQRLIDSQPRPDVQVLGLGHHVTYWDHQGWRDRFASEALTDRQQRYGTALHVDAIYTPQMVVDGRFQFVGSDTKAGRRAIDDALAQPHGVVTVSIQPVSASRVAVAVTASALPAVSRGDRADILIAITEDGLRSSVRAGENSGRTLAHAAVVRRLTTIGDAAGPEASARTEVGLDREWQRDKVKVVAFVQERSSRRVLGSGDRTASVKCIWHGTVKEYPYWRDSLDSHPSPPPLELPDRVDVAIIGAGYTGLSAARELARHGASVVVLERDRIGSGASSRNGGQVLTGLKLDSATLLARFGEPRARSLFAAALESIAALEGLIAEEAMDCEYQRTGHLDAANKPSHFQAFREEQSLLARVFHHRVELISADAQGAEIGSSAYHGLMLDERSGALNPAKYVRALAAAACRAGAAIAEDTQVTAVRRRTTGWTLTTGRGPLDAGDVLAATNGYTDRAIPWLQRRLVPIGSYIIATEPLSEGQAAVLIPKRRMVFDSKYFLHYFRLSRDNRLLFGGRAQFTRPTADTTRRCAEVLHRDMVSVFPSLAQVKVDYAWSGNVAFTRDQMPHAGKLDGAYYSAGYCGHGVAMATYLGSLIARHMAGEQFDHPLVDASFPVIPFYRGTPWFLPLVGAYYKLLDWLQ